MVQQLLNRASFFDLLAEPQMMATLQSVYLAMLLTFTPCWYFRKNLPKISNFFFDSIIFLCNSFVYEVILGICIHLVKFRYHMKKVIP